jgi:AcrR family transcriptional regulator
MSGLRERNIASAKAMIQACALRLFTKQGYASTTVEQIAEAAEVSQSTFFRYFKTKEAVILYDNIDPIIIKAFMKQPTSVPTIRAMRNAVQELDSTLSEERKQLELQRFKLLSANPLLRNKAFGEMAGSVDAFASIIGQRAGKDPNDIAVRNVAGAIVGVMVAVLQQVYDQPSMTVFEGDMDAALARLEQGLEL